MKGKGSVRRRLVSESSDEELLSVRKSARRKAAVTYDDSINSDWERDASLMVKADGSPVQKEVVKAPRSKTLARSNASRSQAREKTEGTSKGGKKQNPSKKVKFSEPRIIRNTRQLREGHSTGTRRKKDDNDTPVQNRKRAKLELDSSESEPDSKKVSHDQVGTRRTREVKHSNKGGTTSPSHGRRQRTQQGSNEEIEEIVNPSLNNGQETSQAMTTSPQRHKSILSPKFTNPSNMEIASELAQCQMEYNSLLNKSIHDSNKERAVLMHDIAEQTAKTDRVIQAMQDTAIFWRSESEKQAKFAMGYQGASSMLKDTQADVEKLKAELAEKETAYKELEEKLKTMGASTPKVQIEVINASVQTRYPEVDPTLGEDEEPPEARPDQYQTILVPGFRRTSTKTVATQVCPDSPSLNEGANLKSSPYAIFGRNSEGMDLNMPLKVIDVDGGQDEQMENAEKTVEITTSADIPDRTPEKQPNDFGSNIGSACTSKSASQSPTAPQATEPKIIIEDTQAVGDANGTAGSGLLDSRLVEARKDFGFLVNMAVLGFSVEPDESGILQRHPATGFAFRLQQTQEYEDTFREITCEGETYTGLRYTPLEHGTLGNFLPEWLKEGMVFPKCDSLKLVKHILDALLETMTREITSSDQAILTE